MGWGYLGIIFPYALLRTNKTSISAMARPFARVGKAVFQGQKGV